MFLEWFRGYLWLDLGAVRPYNVQDLMLYTLFVLRRKLDLAEEGLLLVIKRELARVASNRPCRLSCK